VRVKSWHFISYIGRRQWFPLATWDKCAPSMLFSTWRTALYKWTSSSSSYHSRWVVYHNQQCCLHLKTLGEKQPHHHRSRLVTSISQSTVLFTFENIGWNIASSSSSFAFSGIYHNQQCCLHLKTLDEKQQQHYHSRWVVYHNQQCCLLFFLKGEKQQQHYLSRWVAYEPIAQNLIQSPFL